MSQLTSLLKAMMSGGLKLFNYQAKTEGSKRIMPLVLGALIGMAMLVSASTITTELALDGAQSAILSLYTLIVTMIIVMEGSYKAGDLLFKPRDNDMLLAMPIKRSTIVLARMIKFYVFEMVYCLIFLLPAIIAYAMNAEVGMSFWLVAATMLVLIPAIPIAVACVIGLIISAISGRFKHKTFLQVTLSIVVMFATVGFVLFFNTTTDSDGQSLVMISNAATEYYYPATTFVKLVEHFDILEYLVFVAINLAVVGLTALLIGRFYFKITSRLGTANQTEFTNNKYSFAKHSQTGAMIRKEVTKYFNTPVLLVNTAMGLVFFIMAVGILCFKFDELVNSMINSVEDFPLTADQVRSFLPGVTFAMVAFASLLTCITATMISLEGKAFNVLRTLPISGRKVLISKVLASMLLILPVTLSGCFVMFFRFQFGILEAILVLIGAIAMPLVTELIGILINLKYPRFDADSDTVVVRQSASVMAATFLGLGMVLFTISLTFGIVFLTGQIIGLTILDAVYVILALFLYFALATLGEEKYTKLSA